ncbi:MAG: hypothetical protein RRZ42_07550, partial [Oscillospiraceae bacterium]
ADVRLKYLKKQCGHLVGTAVNISDMCSDAPDLSGDLILTAEIKAYYILQCMAVHRRPFCPTR